MATNILQEEGHLVCANCNGTGKVVVNAKEVRCVDCDGWGSLLDIDSYELPATGRRGLIGLAAFLLAANTLVSPASWARWDDLHWLPPAHSETA